MMAALRMGRVSLTEQAACMRPLDNKLSEECEACEGHGGRSVPACSEPNCCSEWETCPICNGTGVCLLS